MLSKVKTFAKKALAGVLAGLTSTEAIKAEKFLAATVITRLIVALGGTAGAAALILKLAHLA